MAEIEYGGVKASGSKLLLIIPLLGTIGGGLWGGFEFYKDYQGYERTDTRVMLRQTYQDLINKSQYSKSIK